MFKRIIMKKLLLTIVFIFILAQAGLTTAGRLVIEGRPITGKLEISGGTVEIPNSTSLPATCVVGEIYMDTNATSGQRCYLCESADVWVLQGNGSSIPAGSQGDMLYKGASAWLAGKMFINIASYTGTDTEKIQAAIDAAEVNGGTVYIPAGTYSLNATLTIEAGNVGIIGSHLGTYLTRTGDYGSTILVRSNPTGTRLHGFLMRDIFIRQLTTPATASSPAHIQIDNFSSIHLDNVRAEGGFVNFKFEGVGAARIVNCMARAVSMQSTSPSSASGQMLIARSTTHSSGSYAGSTNYISNFEAHDDYHDGSGGNSRYAYTLQIQAGDGLWITNSHFGSASGGNILFNPTSIENISATKFTNCYFDSNAAHNVRFYNEASTGGVAVVQFNNCLFRNAASSGMFFASGAAPNQITVTGNIFREYDSYGIYQNSADVRGLVIADNLFDPHGASPTTAFYAVANSNDFTFQNNLIKGTHSANSITISTGCTDFLVAGNMLADGNTRLMNSAPTFTVPGDIHATGDITADGSCCGAGSGDVTGPATHSANYVPQWNATPNSKTLVEGFAITAAGKAILDDADAAAQCTTLGLGTANAVTFATVNTGQGANELYDMDQNMLTTSSPTFANPLSTSYYKGRSNAPGFWLDEIDGGVKGAYAVVDTGIFQIQRRATNFGAYEATPFYLSISAPTNAIYVDEVGHIGFGKDPTTKALDMNIGGGYCTAGGVWTDGSSREYKTNIRDLNIKDALSTLTALSPIRYNPKSEMATEYLGFIAEDVPDLVASGDRKGMSPMNIVAVLTKVVQEHQKNIVELCEKTEEQALYILQLHERLKTLENHVQ